MTHTPMLQRNQNYWHLASIQAASLGLPIILVGGQIAVQHGKAAAITSLLIGDLILWALGLTMISMSSGKHLNGIENIQKYLGKWGGTLALGILFTAFLTWYPEQLSVNLVPFPIVLSPFIEWTSETKIAVGAFFGFGISMISLLGINAIKWICTICFPLFVAYFIYALILRPPSLFFEGTWLPPISGIMLTVAVLLPGIINLPTFFRHGKKRNHPYLGLSIMIIFLFAFQVCAVLLQIYDPKKFIIIGSFGIYQFVSIIFLSLSIICTNLVNIYFAAAGFEVFRKKKTHTWIERGIAGMVGTMIFGVVQYGAGIQSIGIASANAIANIGIVLLATFLTKLFVNKETITNVSSSNSIVRFFKNNQMIDKAFSNFCWIFGTIFSLWIQWHHPQKAMLSMLGGMGCSVMLFGTFVLFKQTFLAIERLKDSKKITKNKSLRFWELGILLGVGGGLPAMFTSAQIAAREGIKPALLSIYIGNLVLWLIGLSTISMAGKQNNAIQNIKLYLGDRSGLISSLIITTSFLLWYGIQIKSALFPISHFFNDSVRPLIGLLLGILVAIIATGGLHFIKYINMLALIFLVILGGYLITENNTETFQIESWKFSMFGTL